MLALAALWLLALGGCAAPPDPSGLKPESASAISPEEAVVRGLAAAQEHDWAGAIECFQVARRKAPYAPAVLFNLGLAYAKDGQEFPAVAYLEAYLATAPESAHAETTRQEIARLERTIEAKIRRILEQAGYALEAIEWLVHKDARDNMLRGLASKRAYCGDMEGALKTFSKVLTKDARFETDRQDVVCQLPVVERYLEMLNLEAARAELAKPGENVAKLFPDLIPQRLASIYESIYNLECEDPIWLDRAWSERLKVRNPSDFDAGATAFILQLRLRDGDSSTIQAVENAVRGVPEGTSTFAATLRGKAAEIIIMKRLELGDTEGAWRVYEGPWFPKTSPPDTSIALGFVRAGDSLHARAVARDAIRLRKAAPVEKAILMDDTDIRTLLERTPSSSQRAEWMQVLIGRGDFGGARSVATSDPKNRESLLRHWSSMTSRAHARQGNVDQAVTVARQSINLDDFPELAAVCVRAGKGSAVESLIHADEYATMARIVAEAYRQVGRRSDALRLLAAARHRTFDRRDLLAIAREQEALGDVKEARVTRSKAPSQAAWTWLRLSSFESEPARMERIERADPKEVSGILSGWAKDMAAGLYRIRRTRIVLAGAESSTEPDPSPAADLKAATSRVERARSELAEAQRDLDRLTKLREAGSASQDQVGTAQTRVAHAKIKLELSELRRKRAEKRQE